MGVFRTSLMGGIRCLFRDVRLYLPDVAFWAYLLLVWTVFVKLGYMDVWRVLRGLLQSYETFKMTPEGWGLLLPLVRFAGVAVVVTFLVGSFLSAVKLGVISDLVLRRRVRLGGHARFFGRFVLVRVVTFTLFFLAFLVGAVGFLAALVTSLVVGFSGLAVGFWTGAALFSVAGAVVNLGLFFRYQVLFCKRARGWESVRESWGLFRQSFMFVAVSAVVLFLCATVVQFVVVTARWVVPVWVVVIFGVVGSLFLHLIRFHLYALKFLSKKARIT